MKVVGPIATIAKCQFNGSRQKRNKRCSGKVDTVVINVSLGKEYRVCTKCAAKLLRNPSIWKEKENVIL